MRVCLVSQADDTCEIIGNALIKLDIHVCQAKTERWYCLSKGCDGTDKVGHIRVRTLWTPSEQKLSESLTADQEPQQVPITFLDGTQAANTIALQELQPFFKAQPLKHCEALRFDPCDPELDPLYNDLLSTLTEA